MSYIEYYFGMTDKEFVQTFERHKDLQENEFLEAIYKDTQNRINDEEEHHDHPGPDNTKREIRTHPVASI